MESKEDKPLVIVGAGILGLSIAEQLSREKGRGTIFILKCPNTKGASYAAAANLHTKGQRFGRDPHFKWKLLGKEKIEHWLKNLVAEDLCEDFNSLQVSEKIQTFYSQGIAKHTFAFEIEGGKQSQLKRMQQPALQLKQLNLPPQPIECGLQNEIRIDEEQWVHAEHLLDLLERILNKRGVVFEHVHLSDWNQLKKYSCKHLILSPGVGILELWKNLQLPQAEAPLKPRISWGTVFFRPKLWNETSTALFWEHTFSNQKSREFSNTSSKVTLTFTPHPLSPVFASSVTVKDSPEDLITKESEFLKRTLEHPAFGQLDQKRDQNLIVWSKISGVRIGFGHSEIFAKHWEGASALRKAAALGIEKVSVLCGAHKSGYSFAPVAADILFDAAKNSHSMP